MRDILTFIFMVFLSSLVGYFGHWMASMISVALPVYIMRLQPGKAALLGFISLFLVWATLALVINQGNDGLLATKIGQLMGGLSPIMMVVISGMTGGIGAALCGWSTALVRIHLIGKAVVRHDQEIT